MPIFYTVCLLSSSLTIHVAVRALRRESGVGSLVRGGCSRFVLGAIFLFGTRARVASSDQRRRSDDQYESFRHDLLLAGRPACVPRDDGAAGLSTVAGASHFAETSEREHAERVGDSVDVLALRRRGLGGGLHGGLRDWKLDGRSADETRAEHEESIEMPAPTAWPIVLAFGLTLVFAGMVTLRL